MEVCITGWLPSVRFTPVMQTSTPLSSETGARSGKRSSMNDSGKPALHHFFREEAVAEGSVLRPTVQSGIAIIDEMPGLPYARRDRVFRRCSPGVTYELACMTATMR